MLPIDAFQSSVSKIATILRQLEIRFHLTGGITSIAFGEPRLTQGVDIVIENLTVAKNVDSLLRMFDEKEFQYFEDSVRNAIKSKGMFQLFDLNESLKLDIYPREMIPGELDRSENFELFDNVTVPIVSLVDAALSKLVWIKKGSGKSRSDFRYLFEFAKHADKEMISKSATEMQMFDLMEQVLAEPDQLQ